MPRFKKKPVEIEAVRLTAKTIVHTREGKITGTPGDWLITGIAGEQYPCKHSIFLKTYEPIDDHATQYLEKQIKATDDQNE